MLTLKLPYPPSVNAYWGTSGKRRYVTKRGMEFKRAVAEYVIENNVPKLGDVPIKVFITLIPRSKVLMDIDNCCKAILDSCQDAGIYNDDVQVEELMVIRGAPAKGGGCVVVITEKGE